MKDKRYSEYFGDNYGIGRYEHFCNEMKAFLEAYAFSYPYNFINLPFTPDVTVVHSKEKESQEFQLTYRKPGSSAIAQLTMYFNDHAPGTYFTGPHLSEWDSGLKLEPERVIKALNGGKVLTSQHTIERIFKTRAEEFLIDGNRFTSMFDGVVDIDRPDYFHELPLKRLANFLMSFREDIARGKPVSPEDGPSSTPDKPPSAPAAALRVA